MKTDVKHPHRTFFGLSSFQMLAMFRRGLFYSYLSIYLRFFLGMSVTETTLFATLPMIFNIFFQMFVWGILSDKFQLRRTFVILGEILAAIGTLIVFFTHRIVSNFIVAGWVIIIGLSIVEIFWSMSNIGWAALISDLYSLEQRNKVQGRLASLGGLGRIFGVWAGGLLYDGLKLKFEGWGFFEGSLFFIAAFLMFSSTIPMLFVPEGGIQKEMDSKREIDKQELHQNLEVGNSSSQTRVFLIFLLALIFINFGRNSIAIILPQYLFLDSGFAVSSELLGYIINLESIGIILLGLVVGWISVRIGNGKTILLGAGTAMLALLIYATSTHLIFIFIASFLRGAAQVLILASAYAFASEIIPSKDRAKLFSYYNATFFLSWGISGTIITGPVTDYLLMSGTEEVLAYQIAFFVAALVTVIGILILSLLLIWISREGIIKKVKTVDHTI